MSVARTLSIPSMISRPSITWGCGPWPWRGRIPSCDGPPNQRSPRGARTIESLETRVLAASACSWVQLAAPGRAPSREAPCGHPLVEIAFARQVLLHQQLAAIGPEAVEEPAEGRGGERAGLDPDRGGEVRRERDRGVADMDGHARAVQARRLQRAPRPVHPARV